MTVAKLATCCVPEDNALPTPTGGYVGYFVTFYERGFVTPLHRLLCSLLRYYGLELHHLTPSVVLHIAAFMTLCEAYLGIDAGFDLSNYVFRVWRP
jgi:hypothetical protein